MFEFEKFPVYIKSEQTYAKVVKFLTTTKIDQNLKDQLRRAALSVVLNIAEGAGKYSKKDKKNFYTISRGSVHECVAILRILRIEGKIDKKLFQELYSDLTEISKMLSGLINSMTKH